MSLDLHQNAVAAFNTRANHIASLVERVPAGREVVEKLLSSDTDPYVSAVLNQESIVGSMFGKDQFEDGSFSKATLITDSEKFELKEDGCAELMALSESVWRAGSTSSLIQKKFIDRAFFDWVALKPRDCKVEFVEFLDIEVEAAVQECKVLIPLHRVRSTVRFRILGCLVREVNGGDVEQWFPSEKDAEYAVKMRRSLQGFCCVEVELSAEPSYAAEEALRIANIIASMIAMHSLTGVILGARYNGVPLGREITPTSTAIVFTSADSRPTVESGLISSADMRTVDLNEDLIVQMGKSGLFEMASLFDSTKKTELETKIRDSVSTFSRASLTQSTSEKLVFAVVAMEALFIANESEPIGQNLAERLAMHLGSSLEERRSYAANVKKAYALRSRYVHHGKDAEDSKIISDFLMLAYRSLTNAIVAARDHSTKAEFIAVLDDMKYSG